MKEENKVYKKVNGKYEEVGFDWSGFPQDGVWLVKDGSNNCIMKMDDVGKKSLPFIDVMKHKNDVMEKIYKLTANGGYSNNDIVDTVLEYIADNIEYEKYV